MIKRMDLIINEFIKNKKALVVEDEISIAQLLKIHLLQLGFEVDVCQDAESAFVQMKTKAYDLCLLDWMLPGIQGVDFLKKIKPMHKYLKIMMVTAKVDSESIVLGLEAGADDYLQKPFDARVLVARVRQLMRRLQIELNLQNQIDLNTKEDKQTLPSDHLTFDELTIYFAKHVVIYKNKEIHLTLSEFKLLEALFKSQGLVLTREQLINSIQGEDVSVTGRTIDTHVFALRKKIGVWSKHIETIRGVGYRILISIEDESEPEKNM